LEDPVHELYVKKLQGLISKQAELLIVNEENKKEEEKDIEAKKGDSKEKVEEVVKTESSKEELSEKQNEVNNPLNVNL